jgi:3D (Asp-Asp-Asp) domain-containing protein
MVMVRARGLTPVERWELGLLLVLFCVACLCLAAIVRVYSVPKLLASGGADKAAQNVAIAAGELPKSGEISESPRTDAPGALPVINAEIEAAADAPYVVEEPIMSPADFAAARAEYKYYGGKKYQYVRTVRLQVTAYAPDPRCCWPYDGTTTASGLSVKTNGGKLVAADTKLIPMHSLVSVQGYASGAPVPVLDRGGAIKGHRLDVLLPTYDQAKQWGTRAIDVKVYQPVK